LVRAVADSLCEVTGLQELADRWEHRSAITDEAVDVTGERIGYNLGVDEIAGAGFAMRRRELLAELAERRRRAVIAEAREAGQTWAVVHESGDMTAGLADPYQCIELHIATGLAVVATVEPDPSTMKPVYVAQVAEMGDEDGNVASGMDAAALGEIEADDSAYLDANRAELRQRVEHAARAAGAA